MNIESVGHQRSPLNKTIETGPSPRTSVITKAGMTKPQDTFIKKAAADITVIQGYKVPVPPAFRGAENKFNDIKQMVTSPDFSKKEFLKNFGKGMIEPFKFVFESPRNMAIGAALLGAGTVIINLGGGPILVALDVLYALINAGNFTGNVLKAKTPQDIEKAGSDLGKGMLGVYGMAGAKIALKNAGIEHKGGTLSAAFKSFGYIPKSFRNMGHNLVEGYFKGLGRLVGIKSPANGEKTKTFINTLPNPFTVGNTVTNAITSSGFYEAISRYLKEKALKTKP